VRATSHIQDRHADQSRNEPCRDLPWKQHNAPKPVGANDDETAEQCRAKQVRWGPLKTERMSENGEPSG
jgi:hypothetical protein